MKKEILKRFEDYIDKSIELVDEEDEEKLVGRMMLLAGKAQEGSTAVEASIELCVLAIVIEAKAKE